MTNTRVTPKVWIGCLACYNGGALVGEWFDALDCVEESESFMDRHPYHRSNVDPHEETWVMDHEGFGGLLMGECSPMEAQAIAQAIDDLPGYVDVEAFALYAELFTGGTLPEVSDFEEHYHGVWDSEQDYAMTFAEDTGAIDPKKEMHWPYTSIDWESATRELFMDMHSEPATGGGYHIFSN